MSGRLNSHANGSPSRISRADDLLCLDDGCSRRAARVWLWSAVAALLIAGLFALLLVVARTPGLQDLFPGKAFFRTALVVHVNLSVLVWFLCMAGLLWSLNRRSDRLETLALGTALFGFVLMVASPFIDAGPAYLNNYIPMFDSRWFQVGLCGFAAGLGVQALRACRPADSAWRARGFPTVVAASAFVYLVALAITLNSIHSIPTALAGEARYELMFWGGGHLLQLTHTVLAILAWMILLRAAGVSGLVSAPWAPLLLLPAAAPVLLAPWIEWQYGLDSLAYRRAYTDFMRYAGLLSLPAGLLVLVATPGLRRSVGAEQRPLSAALVASLLLFAAGGLIGFLIEGVNVVIPAHYHGSIVGVTLAFMGLVYWFLPRLGYLAPTGRLANWQPVVYGGGQLLHVLGLAWSGGYGVQRKAAGADQALRGLPEIVGMTMMGLGGLIAVCGGVLFLVVVLRCWRSPAEGLETGRSVTGSGR